MFFSVVQQRIEEGQTRKTISCLFKISVEDTPGSDTHTDPSEDNLCVVTLGQLVQLLHLLQLAGRQGFLLQQVIQELLPGTDTF